MKKFLLFGLSALMILIQPIGVYCDEGDNTAVVYETDEDGRERTLVPIQGLDGYYVSKLVNSDGLSDTEWVTDKDGNKLSEVYFHVNTEAGIGDTISVSIKAGMSDTRQGLLNKDLKEIVPCEYGSIYVREQNGIFYVEAPNLFSYGTNYYDLEGNKIEDLSSFLAKGSSNAPAADPLADQLGCDSWAVSEIQSAIDAGIVPAELQSNYKNKITRKEFCKLAMMICPNTADAKSESVSPFTDVNDEDVTRAYNQGVVSGRGKGIFAPDDFITRQEAAVMLCNLARVMEVDYNIEPVGAYVDESYFADWAKDSIYRISGIKADSGLAIMTGTGNGKFSPWFNYQRQQAIATMLRLYRVKPNTTEDYRLSFKSDIDDIAKSYAIGSLSDSLFTEEKAAGYVSKWNDAADTSQKGSYVVELDDAYRTTIRYLEFCEKLYSDENEDKETVSQMADEIVSKFTDVINMDEGEILDAMHGSGELETIRKYGYMDKYYEIM